MNNSFKVVDVASAECILDNCTVGAWDTLKTQIVLTDSSLTDLGAAYHSAFTKQIKADFCGINAVVFAFSECMVLKRKTLDEEIYGAFCLSSNQEDVLKLVGLYKYCVAANFTKKGSSNLFLLDADFKGVSCLLLVNV